MGEGFFIDVYEITIKYVYSIFVFINCNLPK